MTRLRLDGFAGLVRAFAPLIALAILIAVAGVVLTFVAPLP